MNTSRLKTIIVAATLALTISGVRAELKIGDAAPDLSGYQLDGKLPDSLKGKVVVMDFWASWCAPCARSFPVLDELQKKYGDHLVIVAVNIDEKAANMDTFLKKHPVSFHVVRDANQKLVAVVEPPTMPSSYVVDATGKVRYTHNGFHGDDTRKEYVSEIETLIKESQ